MKSNKIMLRMTKREISKNWLQYLAMIIIDFLAVTLFCGFISNTITIDKTVQDFYRKTNLTDLVVQLQTVTNEDINYLQSLEVEHEYRLYLEGYIEQKNTKIFVGNNSISTPYLIDGTPGVLIDSLNAKNHNLKIGDTITLNISSLITVQLKIDGLMYFAEVVNATNYFSIYIDETIYADTLSVPISYNQILIKSENSKEIKNNIMAHYKDNMNYLFTYDHDSIESIATLNQEVTQSLKMMSVFPVIFLLVAILVIMTTISPLIIRERTNIGTLKALGIKDRKILLHYASYGSVICFIGGLLGAIIGPQIIPRILLVKYKLLYSIPLFTTPIYSFAWSLFFIISASLLAFVISIMITNKVIKEKPAQCMRPLILKTNKLLLKTINKNNNSLKSRISFKMAIRNILIKPSRAVMTIIGVMGCSALLACSFGIGDTIDHSLDLELGEQFKYDISSSIHNSQLENFKIEMDNLLNEDKIEAYEIYQIFIANVNGKDIKIFNIDPNSIFTTIKPDNKTIISKSIAKDIGVNLNDTITVSISGHLYDITIDEIIDSAVTKGIFISSDFLNQHLHNLEVWVKTTNDIAIADYLNTINGTNNAITMTNLRSNIDEKISSLTTIRITIMIFAISLSIVVLYNLSLLNIKERHRDLATLKVLGFSTYEIINSLLIEIMILVILGTSFGLMLGYPLNLLVMAINRIEVLNYIYYIRPLSYLYTALLSLITAIIINFIFTYKIKKIHMIESLKSVE